MIEIIEIIEKVTEFDYFDQDFKVGTSKIKALIRVSEPIGWVSKQLIGFEIKGDYIKLDLTGVFEDTKSLGLYWKNFSNTELITFGLLLDLKISRAENIDKVDNLIAEINDEVIKSHAEIAFKRLLNRETYYTVVYYLSRPDKAFEGKLYVHGIWEITLSEGLRQKLKLS